MKVAVLGTGTMGAPMAVNMAKAGLQVRVWNRTREKAERVEGASVAETPAEAVRGVDVVVTMLADGRAVQQAIGEAFDAADEDLVWIQASTVGIGWTERLEDLARAYGVAFVDTPVLGTREPAERAQLVVLASGPPELRDRCKPIFDAIGQRTVWAGTRAGDGTRLKLVLNSWLLALVDALAETIVLARALGVDPNLFVETITGTSVDVPYAHVKGRAMIEEEFPPSFSLALARKDAGLVLEAAEHAGIELPLFEVIAQQLDRAFEAGHGAEDLAAVYYAAAEPVPAS